MNRKSVIVQRKQFSLSLNKVETRKEVFELAAQRSIDG
jgi:hypothetical protein